MPVDKSQCNAKPVTEVTVQLHVYDVPKEAELNNKLFRDCS